MADKQEPAWEPLFDRDGKRAGFRVNRVEDLVRDDAWAREPESNHKIVAESFAISPQHSRPAQRLSINFPKKIGVFSLVTWATKRL